MGEPANYYGKDGLILKASGKLSISRDGLATGRCVFQLPPKQWGLIPELGSAHPYASFCGLEKIEVEFAPGFWLAVCDFAGVQNESSEKRFGLTRRVRQEPIETHPDFQSAIGGTPSAPLNGAVFLDETGHPTSDDTLGIFDRFRIKVAGGPNPLAGTTGYFAPTNTLWRATWTSRAKPSLSQPAGKIDNDPLGAPPDFGDAYTWLYMGIDSEQRGNGKAWSNSEDWMLGIWSPLIYG